MTDREREVYEAWVRLGEARLSPDFQARLYTLFLQGHSCEAIAKMNKGIRHGQVLVARVEGEWDRQRDDYLQDLMDSARSVLQQSSLEGVRFLADVMAATHKMYGDAARRYLLSGDPKDLKGFRVKNLMQYGKLIENLRKLTGQEDRKDSRVDGDVRHHHVHEVKQPVPDAREPMKAPQAQQSIRAALKAVN